jgi:hypothetical protein
LGLDFQVELLGSWCWVSHVWELGMSEGGNINNYKRDRNIEDL